MSLLRRGLGATESVLTSDGRLIGRRSNINRKVGISEALRISAVWACLRLRADLISTMPVDAYRRVDNVDVEITKPPVLVNPGGDRVDIIEHMYSSQFDLDRSGNSFGIITERDGVFKPRRIDLVPFEDVTLKMKDEVLRYRVGNKWYDAEDIWHERQFTISGSPIGLSPVAYAALSAGNYLSAAEFARDWFDNGSVPAGRLRNKNKKVPAGDARAIKERFKAAVQGRDLFVHGADWEYEMISVAANESQFLETMKAGIPDICRFLGVPGDMIDAESGSNNVTYANVTQRNLQLLILNLQPAIVRREAALSRLLPAPRFVKLNTDAVLRMDPATREDMLGKMVSTYKTLAPSEARALSNRPPFTSEQIAEMKEMGLITKGTTTPTAGQPENGAQS